METKKRLSYIDNLRMFVIILVVVLHISLTYSGTSVWYYPEVRPLGFAESAFFSFFQTFLQSFFMGFLFMIAGYFVPRSYDRKGFGKFIKDRAVRLGIPALIYMFIVDPLTEYYLARRYDAGRSFFNYYIDNITGGHILTGTGPLWFAIVLLLFSVVYAFLRFVRRNKTKGTYGDITPGVKYPGVLLLVIAVFAFIIRIWIPTDTSFFNMRLGYFPQYIILFIAGILAYRYDLFSKLSYKTGKRLLCWSPLWGLGGWGVLMISCQLFWGSNYSLYNGGFTFQGALFALWESFTAIAMDFGLLVLFREKYNNQSRFIKAQSDSSFAVYVFHTPIIVAAAILVQSVAIIPVVKFAVMTVICVPLCFALSYIIRKIPILKKVM